MIGKVLDEISILYAHRSLHVNNVLVLFLVPVSPLVIAYEKTVDYNGYKYRYVVTPTHTAVHWVDFYRAQQECVKWGGNLTSIHSQQELNFLKVRFAVSMLKSKTG